MIATRGTARGACYRDRTPSTPRCSPGATRACGGHSRGRGRAPAQRKYPAPEERRDHVNAREPVAAVRTCLWVTCAGYLREVERNLGRATAYVNGAEVGSHVQTELHRVEQPRQLVAPARHPLKRAGLGSLRHFFVLGNSQPLQFTDGFLILQPPRVNPVT